MIKIFQIFIVLSITVFPAIAENPDTLTPPWDTEPPNTTIHYNQLTGYVTLRSTDYPLDKNSGLKAVYYRLDDIEFEYNQSFFIGEGTHYIEFWSIDNNYNVEGINYANFTYDTTPPTANIISPTKGIYLLGDKIASFGNDIICIGGVPIVVDADDGDGTGIKNVYFNILDDSGYDNEAPYEYMFSDAHFGPLTITITAEDNKGLISETVEITVIVYSLGLFKYN